MAICLQTFATALKCGGQEHTRRLIAYPNSGESWDAGVWSWKRNAPLSLGAFEDEARQWAAEGASIVGGCCRTTPAHISMLAQALSKNKT